jgi:hypothetical protein
MCVVLICPEKVRPSIETLIACDEGNPHGGGVAWRRNGAVEWAKTNDIDEINAICHKVKGELIIHFRIASVGGVCNELRHPFPVTHRANLDDSGRTNAVLFQNGTWSGWREGLEFAKSEGHKIPEGTMSDTRAAAFLCSIYGHKFLKKLSPSRWVFFSASETHRFGDWYKRNGIYFSNLYWTPRDSYTPSRETNEPTACQGSNPTGYKTKLDEELELWDMAPAASYWEKLEKICPKPVRKGGAK